MTEGPPGPRPRLSGRPLVAALAGAVALVIAIVVIASGGSDGSSATTTDVGSTIAATAVPTTAAVIVTVAGNVTEVIDAGGFVVNDGAVDYTISVTATTKFVDLGGAAKSQDDIQVGGLVQITGAVDRSTISADTIVVSVAAQAPSSAPQESSQTSQP